MDHYESPPPYNPNEEQEPLQPHPQLYPSMPPCGPEPPYTQSGPGQYPPPGAGPYPYPSPYPTQAPPPSTGGPVYVMNPPTVITVVPAVPQFGYSPVRTTCNQCHADVVTVTQHEVGTMAWLICGSIVLAGLLLVPCALLGCCFIPFCIPDCKDVIHTCPSCNQTLARVPRLK